MLNELYTFAEPVQVVPFSSLKWGKFTLLHTPGCISVSEGAIAPAVTVSVQAKIIKVLH